MPIKYDKLIAIMKERGINSTTIKREKIIGQSAWQKIQNGGDIDTRTLDKLCTYLKCQPGELLSWEPKEDK